MRVDTIAVIGSGLMGRGIAYAAAAGGLGKETVLVRESPGFITSRVNAMIGNEAFLMLVYDYSRAER